MSLSLRVCLAVMVSMHRLGVKFDFAGSSITEYYDQACAV